MLRWKLDITMQKKLPFQIFRRNNLWPCVTTIIRKSKIFVPCLKYVSKLINVIDLYNINNPREIHVFTTATCYLIQCNLNPILTKLAKTLLPETVDWLWYSAALNSVIFWRILNMVIIGSFLLLTVWIQHKYVCVCTITSALLRRHVLWLR